VSEKNTQDVEVGRRVQIFRKRAELTQAQLSTYASQYGDPITQQTIAKIEAGARGLKFAEGIAIAKALRVPAEAFISSDIATERFLRQVAWERSRWQSTTA
jgi:transcriptional regulator with XRE-family HTH domain